MIKNFDQFVNENLLVPRNIEGRKEKRKQLNIRMLSHQEVIDGDIEFDESFMDINPKFVKLKEVYGTVLLSGGKWTEIPAWLKDVEIEIDFVCSNNQLTSLKNCPQKIGVNFYCSNNKLTSLVGCPQKIEGDFSCFVNKLISLEGGPKTVKYGFNCAKNNLESLDYCPKTVGRAFLCSNNKIKLKLPDYVRLKGGFFN